MNWNRLGAMVAQIPFFFIACCYAYDGQKVVVWVSGGEESVEGRMTEGLSVSESGNHFYIPVVERDSLCRGCSLS